MKIIKAYPPNYKQIRAAFPVKGVPGILYAFGDRIYNPSGANVGTHLIEHEKVHHAQQTNVVINPPSALTLERQALAWWHQYIHDPAFRLAQEIPAHRAEWKELKAIAPMGENRELYLYLMAKRLSGPLYGNLISLAEAIKTIEEQR